MPLNYHPVPESLLEPQCLKILKHLRKAGNITFREAVQDYSIQSLTRRIRTLRDAGYQISSTWKKHPITGQRYTEYRLEA